MTENTAVLKSSNVVWLPESESPSDRLADLKVNDLDRYQEIIYPLPAEIGKVRGELIKTKDNIIVYSAIHEYVKNEANPLLTLGQIDENYESDTFFVRLSTGRVLHENLHSVDELELGPGMAIFGIASKSNYILKHDTAKPFTYSTLGVTNENLSWIIGAENKEDLYSALGINASPTAAVHGLPDHVAQILHNAISQTQTGEMRHLYAQSKVLEFLCAVQNIYTEPPTLQANKKELTAVHEFHDMMLNLEGKLPSLQEMSKLAGMNAQKLNTTFKEVYGLPIHSFIARQRLLGAHSTIESTTTPLKIIAARLGYSHVNHFSTAFKREFSYSPSSLRKKN